MISLPEPQSNLRLRKQRVGFRHPGDAGDGSMQCRSPCMSTRNHHMDLRSASSSVPSRAGCLLANSLGLEDETVDICTIAMLETP